MTSAVAAPSVVTLVAVTKAAERALGGKRGVRVTHFPFKVGREDRSPSSEHTHLTELRLGIAPDVNDLYLLEPAWTDLLQISREHFTIEDADGHFWLVDRGSVCGTIVADHQVGGGRTGGRAELRNGDVIVVGNSSSEYLFRFEIE